MYVAMRLEFFMQSALNVNTPFQTSLLGSPIVNGETHWRSNHHGGHSPTVSCLMGLHKAKAAREKRLKKANTMWLFFTFAGLTFVSSIFSFMETRRLAYATSNNSTSVDTPLLPQRLKPAVPLCEECLKVVQQDPPIAIDISYVDVAEGNRKHPHKGARDVRGIFGYVHDATALRKHRPFLDYRQLRSDCAIRDDTYKMLSDKVVVDTTWNLGEEVRIMCIVYSVHTPESSRQPNIQSIRETWGSKCDGFIVGSNKTDPSLGMVNIPHLYNESYANMWQKIRSIWAYVYDNYYEDYDWFHIGGDDFYLIVDNLRLFLESEEIRTAANGGVYLPPPNSRSPRTQTPLYLGRRMVRKGLAGDMFNQGGSGYTINKAALKALVVVAFRRFFKDELASGEDVYVGRSFSRLGIFPYPTQDENGGERYMPFSPGYHLAYQKPGEDENRTWYTRYSLPDIQFGLDHCAERSVSFHYINATEMKRIHAILYNLCPGDSTNASAHPAYDSLTS